MEFLTEKAVYRKAKNGKKYTKQLLGRKKIGFVKNMMRIIIKKTQQGNKIEKLPLKTVKNTTKNRLKNVQTAVKIKFFQEK